MERVLHTYSLPYNPKHPVVCFDERPCFLIGDVLQPIAMKEGQSKREDYQYEKHGSCAVLLAFEPHTGKRWVKVYAQRTAKEYTDFMQFLAKQFPNAEAITLVQDNLNTHQGGSFYKHLDPDTAFTLAQRFDWLYTPKHASWLNMAELEFSALSRQCLNRRIASDVSLHKPCSNKKCLLGLKTAMKPTSRLLGNSLLNGLEANSLVIIMVSNLNLRCN
jgi:DDE superfamily endonuclease